LDRFAFAHAYDFDSARRKATPHGTPMLALTAVLACRRCRAVDATQSAR
jgi:hypothetical protein